MTDNVIDKKKIEATISEDEVIAEVMLQYPELFDMLDFNEYNIKERLERNPYWFQNFRLLTIKEKAKLSHIELLMDKYIGELYHKLRFENDISLGKIEVEKYYIPKDEKVIKFKKLHLKQQIRVETFDAIAKAFEKQGFNMSTFVKNLGL